MASTSRYSTDMPGLYPSPPSQPQGYLDQVRHFSFTPETPGRQVIDSDHHETRKRSHSRYGGEPSATYSFTPQRWGVDDSRFTPKSPPLLAHDRYELAGGDVGAERFSRQPGDHDDYFKLQKERGMWSAAPTLQTGMPNPRVADDMETTSEGAKGAWGLLGNIVGGVAGKLFQFCTIPFRGFQAGGGQKYNLDSQGEIAAKLGLQDDHSQPAAPGPQHTPAHQPSDNFGAPSADSIDERPAIKRLRTGDAWVVVNQNGDTESQPTTPRLSERRLPGHTKPPHSRGSSYSGTPSQIPRLSSRPNTSSKRPSLIPVSRRSTYTGSPQLANTPARQPQSRLSFGSSPMLSEGGRQGDNTKSPLPSESQHLINAVLREEMEDEARMRRMSSQMSAMLREAREALGSKPEIEDDYVEDMDFDVGSSKRSSGAFMFS